MIPFDEVLASRTPGPLYESHYLKANSPDGARAVWIKHTFLVPGPGGAHPPLVEFWLLAFERHGRTWVHRADIPLHELVLDDPEVLARCDRFTLAPRAARGELAGASWSLTWDEGVGVLAPLPARVLYQPWVPGAKLVTPCAGARFSGHLVLPGDRWSLEGWRGLRGHNWGRRHAERYGWLAVDLWEDGAPRALQALRARVRPGLPGVTRWILRDPGRLRAGLALGRGPAVPPTATSLAVEARGWCIRAEAPPEAFVHLRYRQPGGAEVLCRCTKFARVTVEGEGGPPPSGAGELEFLDAAVPPDPAAHPPADWRPEAGDYAWSGPAPHRA